MVDIMKVFQQAQDLQKNMEQVRDDLQHMTLTGTGGGGMVTAEVSGEGFLKRIKVDATVVNPADTEMLEDLIVVAVADAQKKAQQASQERLAKATGGLNLPFKLPF